jgi:hypothetical protein
LQDAIFIWNPNYEAAAAGVECRPHRARLSEAGISLGEELPVKPES